MFKNLSLQAKLLALCLLLSTFSVIQGAASFFVSKNVNNHYDALAEISIPNITSVGEMLAAQRKVRIYITTLGIQGITAEKIAHSIATIKQSIEDYSKADKDYNSVPFYQGEEDIYKPLNATWKSVLSLVDEIQTLALSKDAKDRTKVGDLILTNYQSLEKQYTANFDKLADFHRARVNYTVKIARDGAKSGNTLAVSFVIGSFFIAIGVGVLFSRSLSRSLQNLADRLYQGATLVASASNQISGASTELSSSATEQAAALQETVASIDEVSAMIGKNAENAKKSQDVSHTSEQMVNRGKQVVSDMIHSIEEISASNADIMAQIETSNREISEIVKVIAEIGNKTKVINDIVFQTKLLSFNASVEAARAGEHGKGFAVVAEEVGNLAQMSGNAAKDISQMLEGSIQKVEGIVNNTKTSVERLVTAGKSKVESGTVTARRCGEVLEEIVRNVSQVNQMVGEISTACQEQSQGVHEITRAMGQLDQVTQQNASASQQSASAAESLTSQAGLLHSTVSELMTAVLGASSTSHSSIKSPTRQGNATTTRPQNGTKVVQLRQKASGNKPTTQTSTSSYKKAVGSDILPSENDSRFEDV